MDKLYYISIFCSGMDFTCSYITFGMGVGFLFKAYCLAISFAHPSCKTFICDNLYDRFACSGLSKKHSSSYFILFVFLPVDALISNDFYMYFNFIPAAF